MSFFRAKKLSKHKMHINEFDDDCLLLIFERVPLQQIVYNVGRVCSRWKVLQMEICSRHHSLTVWVGENGLKSIKWSSFHIPFLDKIKSIEDPLEPIFYSITQLDTQKSTFVYSDFDQRVSHQLAIAFPEMKSLKIILRNVDQEKLILLTYLLNQWQTSLECLKIWFKKNERRFYEDEYFGQYYSFRPVDATISHVLFSAINSLSSLKSLLLETPNVFDFEFGTKMPLLGQLNQLYFSQFSHYMSEFEPYLVGSDQLECIGFAKNLTYPDLENLSSEFVEKFTHFTIGYDGVLDENKLNQFCERFSHLRSLSLRIAIDAIYDDIDITTSLAKLTRLVHLRLNFANLGYTLPYFDSGWSRRTMFSPNGPPLKTLKILSLDLDIYSHTVMNALWNVFSKFPSLEFIQIKQIANYRCFDCQCQCGYEQLSKSKRKVLTMKCIEEIIENFRCNQIGTRKKYPQIVVLNSDGKVQFDEKGFWEENLTEVAFKNRKTLKDKIAKWMHFKCVSRNSLLSNEF